MARMARWLVITQSPFKVVLRPKKSSDFKKTPVYFSWNFLIYWSAITNFKILRELGRGENDVKHSLV